MSVLCCVAVALVAAFGQAGECDVAKAELAKYWQAVTGRTEAPVELAVEPSVSASGNDAYTIVSTGTGAKITGSNGRSVLYGVYDLLERRGGCGWFWDGDRVPKKGAIDLSGLDVREESKFAYRGIRYFAHRGLTRFQAEHWGFEDWKREIDWCLKKRLNLFMLRIGQDDYFQKAFPDVCAYPDASKPLPGQHDRYDNRSLFWPLEFRGELRKKVMEYAFARGMMAPEDFGTMTHWYSRTPQDFLDKMKPDFLPQAPGAYGEPSGLVWDIRQKKWMDAYWKLTDTGIREYGRPGLLHTIGIAERRISTNRLENLKMKTEWTNMLLTEAKTRHPESVRLLAGWDLYCMKTPDEVRNFLKGIPEDVVIWDYEADASINTWFGEWDIVGKRPYAFGVFMAYEAGLDPRTDYAKIAARQKLIENDPMCKGYILWPESSHVDSMGLEWFAKNSWRADAGAVGPVVADYCAKRYPDEAAAMRELWMKTIPVSTNMQNTWRWNAFLPILREMNEGIVTKGERDRWPAPKPDAFFADLPKVIATLKELDWAKDELLKRDMTDLARVWADRLAIEAENRLFTSYFKWLDGDESAAEDVCRNGALAVARLNALAELLALHEDFSICDTYDHLRAIHPVALPTFSSVLVDNVANYYCTSHQAELARCCYIPAFEHYLDVLKKRMLANDRTPLEKKCLEAYRTRTMKMGFDELRLKAPRTRESFNAALDRILASSTPYARELVGRGRPDITNKDGAHWWKERHEAKLREAAASAEPYDLVMIGDSITDFWETRPSNGWEMVTNTWRTLNLGFGGDRVQNVIWRLENGALDNCRAKAVTIMIGTNNHAWKLETSEPEATAAAVERIISLVRERQPEARIVLFGIFPRGTSAKDVRLVEAQRRNVEANKLLMRVATQTAVEWVDLTDRYLDPATGFCRPELFRDGTHPSRAGYEIWFEALKKVVNPPPMTPPPALMTAADWATRRGELLKALAEGEYGIRPVERPANLRFTPVGADREALGGRAIRRRVRISYGGPGGEGHFDVLAFLPKGKEKTPVFVQILLGQVARRIGFDPETFEGCSRCPLGKIIDRGYALALFVNWEVAMDDPATCFQTGVFRCWPPKDGVRGPRDWGAISAWAWGASRVMDWIETVPELDAKRVAVIGHSRGGKTALWAGATDPRFACVISNDSGCSGARISHMDLPGAETVARISTSFPHWFCADYRQWGDRQRELPFDQHWLLALIAPRPLAVGSATRDIWAGPKGEFESARLASPAWELFGKKGLVADAFPPPETPLSDGSISYHLRTGKHDLTEADWDVYLDFASSVGLKTSDAVSRGSSFLPVFSAGMGQDGGHCKFPELPVFRAGIPAYSVNSAMKPNPRPFSKNREYPKKYVRRIEGKERRTTPYRFEEMFADPAASIDSEYARSGKPFFVYERMSRPPYFLPTDGCPLAIRESYEAWKKSHPGFIAFNSLWELDSDSNYFENFYDRMGDESIAAELHAAFGPPDAKGRAHRVRWAEKIFRIGADFHFGETTVYPLCSGNPGYEHIFGAMGAKGLWYEATTQSMGPWNTAAAFVRGAARQRGIDYGWYMAHYMAGWTRDGKLVKGHNQRAYGYEGLLKEPHPDRGESRSLFRRKALFGWMIGAKYLMCEAWSHLFIDRVDGRDVPSDSARDFNEIYELSGTTDRGEPFTPLAVLTPLAEPCNVNYQHDKLLDPKTQTDIFNTLVPFLGADGKPSVSRKAGDQGCLFNSEFANAFDVLCPDSGQDSAAFAKALSRYRHVLIAGEAFDKAKFDAAALAAFEKAGGRVHRYPSPECDTPEALAKLLRAIQDETLPVKVEGDVQWGVNFVEGKREEGRGKRGRYLVYLINNKGVVKYCDEPETFDATKVAHVTVTVKATGETFVRDVKPGDFCLLSLEGK